MDAEAPLEYPQPQQQPQHLSTSPSASSSTINTNKNEKNEDDDEESDSIIIYLEGSESPNLETPTNNIADDHSKPLRYGCVDLWTWNRRAHSPEVRLYGENFQSAHFHPNWSSGSAGVRGTRILNNGRYFWELDLPRRIFGTSMMFGIGTEKARLHEDSFTNLLGEDENGWGLSHKGILWHNGHWSVYTKPFRENVATRIGVFFDGIAGTLTFYKDSQCLGVAFRGLASIKEPLFPIICSTAAKTDMYLSGMKRDYINLQDRCRAVIVKCLKQRSCIEKLSVPNQIAAYLAEAMLDSHKTTKFLD